MRCSAHRAEVALDKVQVDLGADGAEEMGPFGALIMGRAGPHAPLRPAPARLVLLADPHFILEPDLDRRAWG